jgi:acyl-CoA reductase-like NAD-dependent aldehyde dehydrogenase
LPLYLLTWKIAPCIAFGCTCVCKPSEFTSVTAGMLAQVFIDAGMYYRGRYDVFKSFPISVNKQCLSSNVSNSIISVYDALVSVIITNGKSFV